MTGQERHAIVAGLSEADLPELRAFLGECARFDRLDLPLPDDVPQPGRSVERVRYYERGALIGYATLPDDLDQPEACLVVAPDHRRQGIGRRLLDSLRSECRGRGLASFLVVCDEAGPAARPFLLALGARHRFSEHRLVLDPAAIDRSRPRIPDLALRPAGAADTELLIRLQAGAFGDAREFVRTHIAHGLADPRRRYFTGRLGDEPVGLLRLGDWGEHADITAFGVLPEHQGRGYGRQMLLDALGLLLNEGRPRIEIEVEADNANALSLYQSCGFRVATTYGYYEVAAGG